MEYKFEFKNNSEIDIIKEENKHLFFIRTEYLLEGNFLVFSDKQPIHIPSIEEIVKEQQDKISILEAENKALSESQDIQDRTLVETDMKMMDIEWALEDLIVGINPTLKNKINLEGLTMKLFERSATYFNQLKQMIERKNYDSKEEMERILNKYRSGRNPRITEEEYDQLFDMLHPPKYDIPTVIPEA